jgi:hypothetical protein
MSLHPSHVEQVKRLLEFRVKKEEEHEARLHGLLVTARGEVGRLEREIRASSARVSELRKTLAEAPGKP